MMPTVRDFMTTNVITIDVQGTVLEAAKLMHQQDVGDLVVMEGVVAKGIVTERDLVRRVMAQKKPLETKVSEVMSDPLITIEEECLNQRCCEENGQVQNKATSRYEEKRVGRYNSHFRFCSAPQQKNLQ